MRGEHIQNLQILGVISADKNIFNQLLQSLEYISSVTNRQYAENQLSGDFKVYYKLNRKNSDYLVIMIHPGAEHNPYFAVFNNKEDTLKFHTDVATLKPLVDDFVISEIVEAIEIATKLDRTFARADKMFLQHIQDYDNAMSNQEFVNSREFDAKYGVTSVEENEMNEYDDPGDLGE